MKRLFTLLAALLLTCSLSWAQTINWVAADQGYENAQTIESVDFDDNVSGTFNKGTNNNAPKYYTTGAAIRCYGGNYFTISSDYLLTEIVLSFASGEGSNAITTDCGTYSNGSWTGSATEVTFTIGGTSGHRRIASFDITYSTSGTPNPSITAENVEIDYDATEGYIEFTVNNPTNDGQMSVSEEEDWISNAMVSGNMVVFSADENEGAERQGIITLTYTYGNNVVSKNVTVTQTANPNGPGSEENPYTVAQARAAIDAGTGTQGVYATGIVSAIPTAYNTQYSNITFNLVDEEGDEVFLQAYRCGGNEAADVAVGDIAVVHGNLTKYGSTYEFGQGCELVSLTHPVITDPYITIPATASFEYGGGFLEEEITYGNYQGTPELDVVYCDANGDPVTAEPDWMSANAQYHDSEDGEWYMLEINCGDNEGAVRTAYLKVTDGTVSSNVMTITQEANPDIIMTIAEVRATEVGTTVKTQGLITSCVGTTAYMQDDEAAICVYGTELVVGYEYTVEGTLTLYKGLLEITDPTCQMVTEGNDVIPEVMTIAFINADYASDNAYQGWLVKIEEATVTAISSQNVTIEQIDAASAEPATITVRFASADDITFAVNDIITLTGNIGCFNGVQIANPRDIEVQENTNPSINLNSEAEVFVEWDNIDCNYIEYEIENPTESGQLVASVDVDWIEIQYIDNSICFILTVNEGTANRVGIITLSYEGAEDVTVTVTQGYEIVPGDWELVELEDLEEGDVFVIVGTTAEGGTYAMTNDNGTSAPAAVAVTIAENTLAGEIAENLQWNITGTPNGYTFYPNGTTEEWLYCTNTNNGVKVGTNETNNIFTVADGYLYNNATSRYVGIYNAQDWRCYKLTEAGAFPNNIKDQTFAYYKRNSNIIDVEEDMIVENPDPDNIYHVYDGAVLTLNGEVNFEDATHVIIEDGGELIHESEIPVTMYKEIDGYAKGVTGYYLVSAPVYTTSDYTYPVPESMIASIGGAEFDLYMFDESQDQEWLNYKDPSAPFNNTLEVGVGYLFSRSLPSMITMLGATVPTTNFTVTLQKTDGAEFSGLNLVGNPFTATAYLADGREFYVLNSDGEIVKSTVTSIAPLNGVFVAANSNNETLVFSTVPPIKRGALDINVSQNNELVDVASINFESANRLEKFQLNPYHTKVFFSEAGKDFASINANNSDDMALNFKAEYDGTYTISINVKDIEMGYLHLIDNMTGADIDLLANPSYSFNAKVSDYASRFRLVFSANGESNDANFAFMSNGNLIVNGQGTLQVIDMTGRVVSTENIDGVSSIEMSTATGVYVVRLTNGNNVKTQKVVVR